MSRRGALLLALGSMSWAVAQWLLVWMFARFAGGPDAVGQYALVLAIATPVFVFAQLGLRTVYLSLPVVYPWRTYTHLRSLGMAFAAISLIIYFGVSDVVVWGLCAAVVSSKVVQGYFDLLQARFQRSNHLAYVGLVSLVNSASVVLLAGIALSLFGTVSAALWAGAAATIAVTVSMRHWVKDLASEAVSDGEGYREILRAGFPTTISESLASLSSYLPILVLAQFASEARVGVLAAAGYLLTFASLSGAILKNVLITSFREHLQVSGAQSLLRRAHRVALWAGLTGCLSAIPVVLAGSTLLQAFYGPRFGMSHADLALLAVAAVAIVPSYVYSATLNVLQLFSSQAWIWAIALVAGLLVGATCLVCGVEPLSAALAVAVASSWSRLTGTHVLAARFALWRVAR